VFIIKDALLDIFTTTIMGLICFIAFGLIFGLLIITIIGCLKFPIIFTPVVVLVVSYAIGLNIKDN